jgi:hypothetical protein
MRSGVCLLAAISWLSWISSLSAGGDLDAAADRSAIEVKNPLYRRLEIGVFTGWIRTEQGPGSTGS